MYYYKLDGHDVVPATRDEWSTSFNKPDRIVRQTRLESVLISTVFLGLDHNFGTNGPPIVFETMIFNLDDQDDHCERYSTWDAAIEGHARALSYVLSRGWPT